MNRAKAVIAVVILCVVVVLLILIAAITATRVQLVTYKSQDMEPTIGQNESIFINKRVGNLKRGDIVIIKYPADHSQRFIKRVIGLPGEVIEIQGHQVLVDRKLLEENYVRFSGNRNIPEVQIPRGSYYVLGDNRESSNDSRNWGPLSADLIDGRVMFK